MIQAEEITLSRIEARTATRTEYRALHRYRRRLNHQYSHPLAKAAAAFNATLEFQATLWVAALIRSFRA